MKITKLAILILAFSMPLGLFGCGKASTDDESDSLIEESKTDAPQDSEPDVTETDAPTEYVLLENSTTEYSIVRSENASAAESAAAMKVYNSFRAILKNSEITYTNDFVYPQNPIREREILVGKTNRAESIALYAELEQIGGYCYIIKEENGKILIGGTTPQMLERAVDYFLSKILVDGKEKITLAKGYRYASEPISSSEPSGFISLSEGELSMTGELLFTLPADGNFKVAQGGCTDGKYFYLILENQSVDGGQSYDKVSHYCKIFKIDASTYKTVKVSEPLLIDHGNDCTYNPKLNQIVVSHNAPNRRYLSFIDADTLTLVNTVKNSALEMYAIAYVESLSTYAVGIAHGFNYTTLDETTLKPQRMYSALNTGYVKQGIDADSKYIYMLLYKENCIVVQNYNGKHITTINLEGFTNEPEALFHIGDQFYLYSYNGWQTRGGSVYKLNFKEN